MRLIYVDEAGTSAKEPVCVVSGIIVEADRQIRELQIELNRVISDEVPIEYRSNFLFHATEIFSGGKNIDRGVWPFAERLDFLKSFVCLPYVYNIPIFLGKVFKTEREQKIGEMTSSLVKSDLSMIEDEQKRREAIRKMNSLKFDGNSMSHLIAFQFALERADFFLREGLNGSEVGTVYVEDLPEMRETLKHLGLIYRNYFARNPVFQRPSKAEKEEGTWSYKVYKIDHIVEQPCFVEKRASPLLQLADACAFAFRRYFTGKEHGGDLLYAMLGASQANGLVSDERWNSGWSSGLFNGVGCHSRS